MLTVARVRRAFAAGAAAIMLLVVCSTVGAQDQKLTPTQLLEDFVHYVRIARPELAAAKGRVLLDSGITDAELAELLDEGPTTRERFDAAIARAHVVPELEDIADELDRRVYNGRLELSRELKRIEESIGWLIGSQRMKMLATGLLVEAGEYAVPSLLREITEGRNERLREAAGRMIVKIRRQAVTPLCAALPHLDENNQRYLCGLLREIGLPHAAPYLMELALDPEATATTREAAARAYRLTGGVNGDLSQMYTRLAKQYFNDSESLVAHPYEPTNNIWSYDPFVGLVAQPVATEIFNEVMAMRVASKALSIDPRNEAALSLFVASNLKRENELPRGKVDPIYGENTYSPAFYATVFGTKVCQDVLSMAIGRLDTPLVRDAIAALASTTGGANLFTGSGGRQPLLEALEYPDRRVQYEAALALGRALPGQRFPGDIRVVPLLASAVRSSDASFAVVIAGEGEDRRIRASWLEDLGFTIVGMGQRMSDVRVQIGDAVGVDLVVVQVSSAEQAIRTVGEIRVAHRTSAAPVLIVASNVNMVRLKREFRDDIRVKVSRARAPAEAFAAAVDEVMFVGSGGRMTQATAEAYAINAIMVLRDIAITAGSAYVIADAEGALIAALNTRRGAIRLNVGDILALIDSHRAQRSLFDAALAASGDEQIELLDRVADSVKRFGDRTQRRHIEALLALITSAGGATAEAAARVHGALVLPSETAIGLIRN